MSTTTVTALDLLWAVHHPNGPQRNVLRALPTTASAVLVATASAQVLLEADPDVLHGSTLATAAFIARTLSLSESTVKGHLRSLAEAGLVKGYGHGVFTTYCANGRLILQTLDNRNR